MRPQRRCRPSRRAAPPQLLDQPPGQDHPASLDQQHGQHGLPHRAANGNLPPGPDHLHRTENTQL
jgi:hypothetical protein